LTFQSHSDRITAIAVSFLIGNSTPPIMTITRKFFHPLLHLEIIILNNTPFRLNSPCSVRDEVQGGKKHIMSGVVCSQLKTKLQYQNAIRNAHYCTLIISTYFVNTPKPNFMRWTTLKIYRNGLIIVKNKDMDKKLNSSLFIS
jgi:hypothetical protein